MLELALVWMGAALALAAATWAAVRLATSEGASRRGPEIVLAAASAALIGFLVARACRWGTFPATDLAEALALFSLAVGGFLLFLARRDETAGLGAFVLPLGAASAVAAAVAATAGGPWTRDFDALFLGLHATSSLAAYAAFACGAAAGVAYLLQERALLTKRPGGLSRRLPSLSTLDDLGYRAMSLGFPLLTFGMVMGSVWASKAWGSYWFWEPKLAFALVLWIFGAAIFHIRTIEGYQGRRTAYLAIAAAVLAAFVFLGAEFLGGGRHAFL